MGSTGSVAAQRSRLPRPSPRAGIIIRDLTSLRGEIKSLLTRGEYVAGIGNAYADEILWWARLHPFRKRASLTPEEVDRLCDGMRACLLEAAEKVRAAMGEIIHLKPQR
jgi:formamidopyrimidine-DNA glycosylase